MDNECLQQELSDLQTKLKPEHLEEQLRTETNKARCLWIQKCELLLTHESEIEERDLKIDFRISKTYSRETFNLDGQMELEILFCSKTIKTVIYIKLDAYDQLLLSEGVCRQLGILHYHPVVYPLKEKKVPGDVRVNEGR